MTKSKQNIVKETLLLLTAICLACSSFSQKLKTYHGRYTDERNVLTPPTGTATYSYYEDEKDERIFHGGFEFKDGRLFINGKYKNNLKDGDWKFTNLLPKVTEGRDYIQTVVVHYKEGNLDGVCSYTLTDKATKKINGKSQVTFKNNLMIGNYEYAEWRNKWDNNFSIKYQLDSTGYYNGDYSVRYIDQGIQYEDKRKYTNGVLQWRLFKSVASGEILYKFENGKEIINKQKDIAFSWELHYGLNFWVCLDGFDQMCGCRDNPVYQTHKGISKMKFMVDYEKVSEEHDLE